MVMIAALRERACWNNHSREQETKQRSEPDDALHDTLHRRVIPTTSAAGYAIGQTGYLSKIAGILQFLGDIAAT